MSPRNHVKKSAVCQARSLQPRGHATAISKCMGTICATSTRTPLEQDDLGEMVAISPIMESNGKSTNLAVGLSRKTFGLLSIAIAPDDAHAERRCGIGIPGVR